jgi:hypothetical protein
LSDLQTLSSGLGAGIRLGEGIPRRRFPVSPSKDLLERNSFLAQVDTSRNLLLHLRLVLELGIDAKSDEDLFPGAGGVVIFREEAGDGMPEELRKLGELESRRNAVPRLEMDDCRSWHTYGFARGFLGNAATGSHLSQTPADRLRAYGHDSSSVDTLLPAAEGWGRIVADRPNPLTQLA